MHIVKTKMLLTRPVIIIYFLLFSLTPATTAFAADGPTSAEYGVVLNLSGKQRMLTQKMSKEILLIALNENKAANLVNLKNTSTLFDKTLKGLRGGSSELRLPATSSSRILRQLDKIDEIWAGFYPIVKDILAADSANKEQVALIALNNLPLLKQMNKAVGLYEKDAKKGGLKAAPGLAATINLAGKQRMLTQKMSKEFLLVAYGYNVEDNKLSLLETYSLFENTLKGLKDGDHNLGLPGTKPQHIRDQLDVVNGLWINFKPIVASAADYKTAKISADKITELAETNLPLLKEMNKAVGMYEKESGK
ncbi:type IV pili methyl-accepting chemotaxis transducer N-terminal domain-containing protein [Psychromonas ossibalaenae]|uniref:type IV pili methyl-accepting chemotaxis transducer N-terminal domain-containing protein n=1 Tax=Psychromonas ossibalaenae TaxID=444922 RepID=UPI00036D558C|nr:type IV pili methyl-accepting chemotaxis transducer N-terminal domain-containing protein [Psychromonas ossibalaenae]